MRIILIGPRSVGKSTVGKILAGKAKVKHFDLDDYADSKLGDLDEYIQKKGIDSYRTIERKFLLQLAKKLPAKFVLSVGGGTVASQMRRISESNCKSLKRLGTIVYLAPSRGVPSAVRTLRARERKRKGSQSYRHTSELYKMRMPIYEKICDIKIIAGNKHPELIAGKIFRKFNKYSEKNKVN